MLKTILKDPKTSAVGGVAAIAALLQAFHIINLTPEQRDALILAIIFVLGLMAAQTRTNQ